MRHLRLLKERTNHESVEQDLRGLGQEPLFKCFLPQSVLSELHAAPTHDFIANSSKVRVLSESSHKNPVWTHHTTAPMTWDYKMQAVYLFVLALKTIADGKNPESRWQLWQTHPFEVLLRSAIKGQPRQEAPNIDELFKAMKQGSHHLWLAPSTAIHLKQAGFDLADTTEYGLALDIAHCLTLYKQEITKIAAATAAAEKTGKAARQ